MYNRQFMLCVSVTDVKDNDGMSPLDNALQHMNLCDEDAGCDVLLYLVRRGCSSDVDKAKILCAACKHGMLDVVKELIEQHNVDPKGEISLIKCMYSC